MNKKEYYIYEHIFPDGSKYVGITKQEPQKRWGKNGEQYKRQPVYKAIQKYGWDNIQHNIIANNLTVDEAKQLEQAIISRENLESNGWNRRKGGGIGGNMIPQFCINGYYYTSEEVANMATAKNITYHDITNRINEHGWSIEKALTKDKQKRDTKYLYKGQYYTISELMQFNEVDGLTLDLLSSRLSRNFTAERALTQPLNVKNQPYGIGERVFKYKGKLYNSYELTQISPIKDLTTSDITCRINHHGWSIEKAITTPKKKTNIQVEYKGQLYNTYELADLADDPSMTHNNITDRLRAKWSIWEILHIPKGITRKQYYKTHNK